VQGVEHVHHVFQAFLFSAQVLGVLGVVPDVGVFEFGVDYVQALRFVIVVKDTSEELLPAPNSRSGGLRVD